ncbi:transposase [uncultured Desulfosarcina sp.]|uniref:transposase n=1 Tax=uncultured Desulfosarcina sp. TaxID=218289 RepID=UPI0037478AAD
MVPRLDSSEDKQRLGRITKQESSYLRTALVEAAQETTRTKSRLNVFFRKRIVRSGYQKTVVAIAREIIQYAYYILRVQTPYRKSIDALA